jgi:hypothetical protein
MPIPLSSMDITIPFLLFRVEIVISGLSLEYLIALSIRFEIEFRK